VTGVENTDYYAMKRRLTASERRTGDGAVIGGTGATVLKFIPSPLRRLADRKRIGSKELRAAEEISVAFHHQSHGLFFKAPSLERRDASHGSYEPAWIIDAVDRYKEWARFWSRRRVTNNDRTLEIVISTVIDERPFRSIEADMEIRNGKASMVVACALRDYAARAGWVSDRLAPMWREAALALFPRPSGTFRGAS
jgi:hypothetical protein